MPDRSPRSGQDTQIIAKRVVTPGMSRRKDSMTNEGALVEKINIRQKLYGRFPIFLHNTLKLNEIASCMCMYRDIQVACRCLAGSQ